MAQQVLPVFSEPHAPDFSPIVQLHRGHDGFVSFGRKIGQEREWEHLFSIKAGELESYFPQLLPTFDTDSYYSINGMYRADRGISPHARKLGLDLPRARCDGQTVRWITSCFADIDCHKLGIDLGTALGTVVNAQDSGAIPPASMLCRSGRGLWVFWFLRSDDDSSGPVRAWEEKIRLWANIQCEVTRMFAAIGADAGSRDVARVTRIPGSINPKSGHRVAYWIQAAADGKPFVYTLPSLATAFNVKIPTRHAAVTALDDKLKKDRAKGHKGQRGRWIKARRNFEVLWELRGAFAEGTRNNAAFLYASILKSQKLDEDVVWCECTRLFNTGMARGKNLFTMVDLKAAIKKAKRFPFAGVRNQTIADKLDVTPEEAAVLDNWPPASRFQTGLVEGEADKLSRGEKKQRRRGLLQSKVAELKADGQVVPPLRDLAAWLTDQGLPTVACTVTEDLKALGIKNPRKPCRRAKSRQRKFL